MEPELVEAFKEIKETRTNFVKQALNLGEIGTLEDSYIQRNDQDEPEDPKSPVKTPAIERKLKLEE